MTQTVTGPGGGRRSLCGRPATLHGSALHQHWAGDPAMCMKIYSCCRWEYEGLLPSEDVACVPSSIMNARPLPPLHPRRRRCCPHLQLVAPPRNGQLGLAASALRSAQSCTRSPRSPRAYPTLLHSLHSCLQN